MMKIRKFEKNSEEWFEYRKGKSGGSAFGKLYTTGLPLKSKIIEKLEEDGPLSPADKKLTVQELADMLTARELAELKLEAKPKDEYYKLIAEKTARDITPNDYADKLNGQPFSMMARGHILEPEAIKAFNEKTGKKANDECVVWERDDNPNIYISPDATIGTTEAVEVKCLESWKDIKSYLNNEIPDEFMAQVLKYFVVNEKLKKVYLLMYTDVIPGLELQIFEFNRKDFADKVEEAKIFEDEIMKRVERDAEKILKLGF